MCGGGKSNITHIKTVRWESCTELIVSTSVCGLILHDGAGCQGNNSVLVPVDTHTHSPGAETAGSLRSLWQRARRHLEQAGSG